MIRPALLLLLALPGPAQAQPLISLPLAPDATVTAVPHQCEDGRQAAVTYVTSGQDVLALIAFDDDPARIFVNVIAASGARYVAGALEWWVKGDQATLTDAMSDADPVTCRATDP